MTSKLWEDSLYVSGKVSDANKQLEKAKERNRESRVWLLVFLLGASFTLLCECFAQSFEPPGAERDYTVLDSY